LQVKAILAKLIPKGQEIGWVPWKAVWRHKIENSIPQHGGKWKLEVHWIMSNFN
jgi:hypothetical protein